MGSEGLNVEREGASRRDRKASQGVECRCESGGDGAWCPPCDGRVPEKLDERALEARLFPIAQVSPRVERAIPDWAQVHAERRHKNVTLALLWHEYKAEHPEGLQYSQFCERYRAWRQRLDVVMRQTHRAGEKLFVIFAK